MLTLDEVRTHVHAAGIDMQGRGDERGRINAVRLHPLDLHHVVVGSVKPDYPILQMKADGYALWGKIRLVADASLDVEEIILEWGPKS